MVYQKIPLCIIMYHNIYICDHILINTWYMQLIIMCIYIYIYLTKVIYIKYTVYTCRSNDTCMSYVCMSHIYIYIIVCMCIHKTLYIYMYTICVWCIHNMYIYIYTIYVYIYISIHVQQSKQSIIWMYMGSGHASHHEHHYLGDINSY